jgi:hypothetical protein
MTKAELPFRVKLKLDGANLIFTILSSDKYEAMKTIQDIHPTASVISAQGSDELTAGGLHQWS